VYIDHAKDLVSEKEKVLNQIETIMKELGANIIEKNLDHIPRLIFSFPKDHKYNFFHRTTIKVLSTDDIAIETMMKAEYPLAFSIKQITSKKNNADNEIELPSSSEFYIFHANHPTFYETLIENVEMNNMLLGMKKDLMQFTLNGMFANARINKVEIVSVYLKFLAEIHSELLLKDLDDFEVEELICYQCNSLFETNEETCDQCGAKRPTCKVCLLDLRPSEKNVVVKTPCCETYAHRKHLITWLEQLSKCPNCRTDLFLWLRGLKQNSSE
ncbi:MAG: hypothetical protein KGD64_15080, partial [Candidatus Heimdallarchaeota archaeon]|nr:hypothetical protein [Candidatus Heimdallarchaeota archaeon]